jgi:hypothetical protein
MCWTSGHISVAPPSGAGIPRRGDVTVLGEIEQFDWLSETRDGACWLSEACEDSVAAGECIGGSVGYNGGNCHSARSADQLLAKNGRFWDMGSVGRHGSGSAWRVWKFL